MQKPWLLLLALCCLAVACATDVDAMGAKIAALKARYAALKAENKALKAKYAALKGGQPLAAAMPASQGGHGCQARSAGAALAWKACPVALLGEHPSPASQQVVLGEGVGSGFDWSQCRSEKCRSERWPRAGARSGPR